MSQPEMVRAILAETGSALSQSYISQIESGARPHLTNKTRQILAKFFKVHPGYLVDDPEGYSPELQSELRTVEDKLDMWLVGGAERFRRDPELKQALLTLAQHEHTRECLLLMESILETPGLVARLTDVLRSREQETGNREQSTKRGDRAGTGEQETARHEKRSAQMMTFYFVCFLAGLMLSAVTLLGGMGHFGGHAHIPHAHLHIPHGPHVAHGAANGAAGARGGGGSVPWWNSFSLMIFLCWFGAAGYLLTRYGGFVAGVVLVLAAICGVAGGAIVFLFLTRVLMPHDRELTADETDVVGAVGRLTSAIRAGGTGEMVYEQMGAIKSAAGAREDGEEIPQTGRSLCGALRERDCVRAQVG